MPSGAPLDVSAHQPQQLAPIAPGSPTISGWWHCTGSLCHLPFTAVPWLVLKSRLPSWERPDKHQRGFSASTPWKACCPHSTPTSAHLSQPSHPPVHESHYAAGPLCGIRLTPLPWQAAIYTFFYLPLRRPPQNDQVAPGCWEEEQVVNLPNAMLTQKHPLTEDWWAQVF